jgi:transposase-like protein
LRRVLFGYRLQLLDYAARTAGGRGLPREACRVFGVHRSTCYEWKRRIERHGLGILRPRERPRPPIRSAVAAARDASLSPIGSSAS